MYCKCWRITVPLHPQCFSQNIYMFEKLPIEEPVVMTGFLCLNVNV
ncbi:hypothetical protein SAMN04488494_0816 [Xylanibacter ruminicola]|uniref:Uncharacterized protein n=1 Tax=Xylanibacter ruminicola TaxID=839 RepID=A0A1M7DQR4_XYLRU|nr:hypothetical protein SAMN04488494_0816 [Xylanibacter ruminicola]